MGAAFTALLARHHRGRQAGCRAGRRLDGGSARRRVAGAPRDDVLHREGDGRDLRVVPHRHPRAIGLFIRAQAHGSAVPRHLAHVAQRPLQEAAARSQRKHPHARRDPLLRLAALAHRHEEFDRTLDGARAFCRRNRQEGDDQVQRLVSLLRPVLDLLGHRRQGALGPAFDHRAHGIHHNDRRRGRISLGAAGLQHRAQNAVGPVGGQSLEPRPPGLRVQPLEIIVRAVRRHIHRLGDRGVDERLHRLHHGNVAGGGHVQRRDEVVGQLVHVAAEFTVQPPGVVFHRVFGGATVGLALLAPVHPRERGLDAVGGVVGKGQADGAGRGDRQQVAVADAVRANRLLQVAGQAAGEGAGGQVAFGLEFRKRALLAGQRHRGGVRRIPHARRDTRGHLPAVGRVVAQAQHGQRIAHAGEAHADASLCRGLLALLLQRPERDIEHVVECAYLQRDGTLERLEIERRHPIETKGMAHKARQDDRPEVAAAIGRQRLFAAGIGRRNGLAITQVVVQVDVVQKQDAWLGKVVGRLHHRIPQFPRGHRLVDPKAVRTLEGALRDQAGAGARTVHQFPGLVVPKRLHERIGHPHRHVEVVPAPRRALGGDEIHHVRVVDAQHAHLRAAPGPGALHRGAGLVEHVDVAARPRSHGGGGLDLGATRANAREIVAHAAPTTHGFGRLAQGFVDAGVTAIVHALDAVAHGLHKAVDQGSLDIGAGRAHDAARADGAGMQVVQEQGLVLRPIGFGLDRSQRTGDAPINVLKAAFTGFEVFFLQHVVADGLGRGGVLGTAKAVAFHEKCSKNAGARRWPPCQRAPSKSSDSVPGPLAPGGRPENRQHSPLVKPPDICDAIFSIL
ncbi:MAG: hypothetical protein BWX79_00778 [Alphaproteobacteria bacterium ADurb.Bin100]|nr:MAG: hypothetical protein BWX79_00778 [Alphaproteobacteria bacterium ADurb.Bin100]